MDFMDYLLPGPSEPGDQWRWGTVTGTSPLRVRLDGETAPLDITPDVLGPVRVGDRVWCQQHGRRLVAHAAVPFPFRESAEPANATNPTMGSSASFQKVYFTALNAGAGATDFTLTGGAVAVNATGRYDIKVSASFSANATGSRGVNIGINGGTSGGRGTLLVPASSVGLTYMTVSDERNLTAGDTAQINLLQNSGATLNVNGWMSIRRVA